MSRSLHFEIDPVNQPAATDVLERASWSSLRIRIGARTVSRVLDRGLSNDRPFERSMLYIPLFAVAEWVVTNWWALLHEPCRSEFLPQIDADEPAFLWAKRHCLRSAESDLLLPALYLHSDGRGLRAEWRADPDDLLPHMPAFFVDSGWCDLERENTEQSLAGLVSDVLDRVTGLDDPRADDLRKNWSAILAADAEEKAYCVIAGRLGLDPYDPEQIPEPLACTLENLGEASNPLVQDITNAASPQSLLEQWQWIESAQRTHGLRGSRPLIDCPQPNDALRADKFGYAVARQFREKAALDADERLKSVEEIGTRVLDAKIRVIDENHLTGRTVKLIVGRDPAGDVRVVGPINRREENERFRVARSLYQAAVASASSPRLVTDAFTWDQRASRAFAAELIAPQSALKSRSGSFADPEAISSLASEFGASTILIEKQLKNAGVSIQDD